MDGDGSYSEYKQRRSQTFQNNGLLIREADRHWKWVQVDIPKGYISEKFLFRKVFIPKDRSLFRKILFWSVIIPKIFIPKGRYFEFRK